MPLALTSQGQVKIFHITMKAEKKNKFMLLERDRARYLLLLNEVSYLYDSRENNPYTFKYPHTWEKSFRSEHGGMGFYRSS